MSTQAKAYLLSEHTDLLHHNQYNASALQCHLQYHILGSANDWLYQQLASPGQSHGNRQRRKEAVAETIIVI